MNGYGLKSLLKTLNFRLFSLPVALEVIFCLIQNYSKSSGDSVKTLTITREDIFEYMENRGIRTNGELNEISIRCAYEICAHCQVLGKTIYHYRDTLSSLVVFLSLLIF